MKVVYKNKWKAAWLMMILASSVWSQTDFQLTVTPSGNPVTVPASGGTQMLTFTVTNDANGLDEGDQTTVTFNIDPQIEPASATSSDQDWQCTSTTGQVTCNYFNIYTAGYSSDIVLSIFAPQTPMMVTGAINADVSNALGDPNPGNDNLTLDINFVAGGNADLSAIFTSSGASYNLGDSIDYGIQLANDVGSAGSPSDAQLLVQLSPNVSFLSTNLIGAPGWNCNHDGATNGGNLSCDRGGQPFNIGDIHDMVVTVLATSPATTVQTQATISSAFDTFTSNNDAFQSDSIFGGTIDYAIDKTVSVTTVNVGDSFTYNMAISSPSSSGLAPVDVIVRDQLPNEVSYSSYNASSSLGTPINCNHDGSTTGGLLTCDTLGSPFQPFDNLSIDVDVVAAVGSPGVVNTATVETVSDPDGTTGNNTSTTPPVVINGPLPTTVSATKTANIGGIAVNNVAYGQAFDYVLQVNNTGAADSINTHISDNIPADVTLTGFDTTGWTCQPLTPNAPGQVVDCTLNTPLAPAASATITLNVMATSNTSVNSITNTMQAGGDNTGALVAASNTVNLQNAMVGLNLTQTPSPVDLGAAVDFTADLTNTGSADLTGVQLDAQLPTGFTYNGFTASAGISCAENQGLVSCISANTLASGAAVNLNIATTAVAATTANQSYVLTVTADANELATPLSQNLNVAFSNSDYSVSMFSTPRQVQQGQTFQQFITVDNSGSADIANINTIYTIPQQAVLVAFAAPDYNCSNAQSQLVCQNVQPLPMGDSITLEATLRVDDFVGLVGGNVSVDADGNRKSAFATTEVVNNVADDLALFKEASVAEIEINSLFSYTLTVVNMGTNAQSAFSLNDSLPNGMVLQNAMGNDWTCQGTTEVTCQYGSTLLAGGQTQLQLDVISPELPGQTTNTASVVLANDENNSNNSASAVVIVTDGNGGTPRSDLSVELETDANEVLNTETIEWRLVVENNGPDAAGNVEISNTFPPGFEAADVQVGSDVECTLLQASLFCDIAVLPAGQQHMITVTGGFMSGFTGLALSAVEVSSDSIDPNPSNNMGTAQVTVNDANDLIADLQLSLGSTPEPVRQGDDFELSFFVKNMGPDVAVNPMITGTFGGLVDSVQVLNAGAWVCQPNSQSFSCQYPGNFMSGMDNEISFRVITQQVVQQSQPFVFNALVESESMDPNPANNVLGFNNDISRTLTEEEIFAIFREAVGSSASDTVIQSIRNVSSYCARSFFTAIEGLCDQFIAGARPENGAAIINAMEELTPNEVAAQSNSAAEIITSQFRNVNSRLAQLRGGGGSGVSFAGLTGRYGNESIPLGMLAYLNQSEEEAAATSNINDFISPWGFFVNGTLSMGERDATGRELGFDFDTYGLTAGVDYRFSPTKVAGLALGYANFDSEIEGEAEMQSTSITLTGYGSLYLTDNLYLDGRLSYGMPDFDQRRRINFTVDDIIIDRIARGSTDASQYSVAMSMGYHFNKNAWSITPNASIRYVDTTIDAFTETGAGDFNFFIAEQEVKSLVWSVGASVSKAISLKNGVISPQFDFNISREQENDGGLLAARFINAPDDEIFWIGTDEPDRTYGSAGIGLVFIGANGKQAYINYRSLFGLDGFSRGTINIGARFEF